MSGNPHLAQINIARMKASLDDPVMKGFVDQLEHINAVADRSPGFVWRLQTEEGDATALRVFEDPLMLVNMSVWESIDTLHAYVYRSEHIEPLRDRQQWFERMEGPHLALWWVPAGHIPSLEEAKAKLIQLGETGPSPDAFTFARAYTPAGLARGKVR